MSQFGWQNCPAGVKEEVETLNNNFRLLLADNLIGIYLHGSIATGCFNPLRSDIDILVVMREKMTLETKNALARLILDISQQPAPIEISFLDYSDLHPWRYPTSFDFHYSEDWRQNFETDLQNGNWKNWDAVQHFDDDLAAHITVLNHRGVCLYGPPVSEVFPPVPEQDFVDSILGDVQSEKFGLDAVFQYPVYVVLNACRTLAFLRTGGVMSKEEGGRWALENLPVKLHKTIADVLEEYRSGKNESNLQEEDLADFTAYMKNEIKQAARR